MSQFSEFCFFQFRFYSPFLCLCTLVISHDKQLAFCSSHVSRSFFLGGGSAFGSRIHSTHSQLPLSVTERPWWPRMTMMDPADICENPLEFSTCVTVLHRQWIISSICRQEEGKESVWVQLNQMVSAYPAYMDRLSDFLKDFVRTVLPLQEQHPCKPASLPLSRESTPWGLPPHSATPFSAITTFQLASLQVSSMAKLLLSTTTWLILPGVILCVHVVRWHGARRHVTLSSSDVRFPCLHF